MKTIAATLFLLAAAFLPLHAQNTPTYPLMMTAVYTAAKPTPAIKTTYHDGDYDCTEGSAHYAPMCLTSEEWYHIRRVNGIAAHALFTLEDGSQVRVQEVLGKPMKGYETCDGALVPIKELRAELVTTDNSIFCQLLSYLSGLRLNQIAPWPSKPFKSGDKVTFHYRLEGVPQYGYQFVQVEEYPQDRHEPYGYELTWIQNESNTKPNGAQQ